MGGINQGRTIRLFLVEGSANGVVTAEIMNWSGNAIAGPRSRLPELLKREEAAKTGVYFLAGPDPEGGTSKLYIGESDNIGNRLRGHAKDAAKDFWERTCLFTSKDQNITKAHARYLESRLIEIAAREGRVELANSTSPETISLPEADISDMEFFIEQIRLILPVLGMEFLRPRHVDKTASSGQGVTFELKSPKYGIKALARENDDEFVVLKGSTAQAIWIGSPGTETGSYGRLHASLIEQGKLEPIDDGLAKFTDDVPFSSPSAASAAVLGRHDNGRYSWRVKGAKKTYAQWQNEQIDNLSGDRTE